MKENTVKSSFSICPECLKKIDADIIERSGKIFLRKRCPEHGVFEDLHVLNYPKMYYLMEGLHRENEGTYIPEGFKLYLTRRCNMYCNFCFERAGDVELDEPSLEQIEKWLRNFKGSSVYFQGGEPTLRKDLEDIIKLVKTNGFYSILFSNGKKLSDESYVKKLKEAGLDYVILSLDSLDKETNKKICGEYILKTKLKAIENLKKCDIYTGIFMKLAKDLNYFELPKMIDFCAKTDHVKTLFLSSVWNTGRLKEYEEVLFEEVFEIMEKKSGIDFKVTEESSTFAHHIFEILELIGLQRGHKEPMCSTNTYLIRSEKGYVPLNHVIDMGKINPKLKKIKDSLKSRKRIDMINSFIHLLGVSLKIVFNSKLSKFWISSIKKNLSNFLRGKRISFMFLDIFSIVVGVFHNKYNIDLDATRTCNMNTVIPETGEIVSQCVRQVIFENQLKKMRK